MQFSQVRRVNEIEHKITETDRGGLHDSHCPSFTRRFSCLHPLSLRQYINPILQLSGFLRINWSLERGGQTPNQADRTWKGALFVGAVGDLHFRISKNCQVKTFEA